MNITGLTDAGPRLLVNFDIEHLGDVYKWQAYTPRLNGTELFEHLSSREGEFLADIDAKEAIWAAGPQTEIVDGVEMPINKYRIVHADVPDAIDTFLTSRLNVYPSNKTECSTAIAAAHDLADNLSFANVETHIDTVFGGLSTAQKTSLKKLYKAVLYLLKKGN